MSTPTAEEMQEYLSIRYVDSLRLVRLASGRWAVSKFGWDSAPQMMTEPTVAELGRLLDEQRLHEEFIKREVAERMARKPAGASAAPKVDVNIEDLFS